MKYYVLHGDVPSKKNSKQIFINRRTGQRFITASSAFKAWNKTATKELMAELMAHKLQHIALEPLDVVEKITLIFYPSTKRASDLTNRAEGVMDLLVDCGVIQDDNWFVVGHLVLQFESVDKNNPRCEIFIEGE